MNEDEERGKGGRSDRAIYWKWLNRDHDGRRRDRAIAARESVSFVSSFFNRLLLHRGDATQSASEVTRFLSIIDSPMDFEPILFLAGSSTEAEL